MIKVMVGVLIGVIAVTVYPNLTDFFVAVSYTHLTLPTMYTV